MKYTIICDTGIISRYLTFSNKQVVTKINEIGIENICTTPLNRIELLNWLSGYKKLDLIDRRYFLKFIRSIPIIHINEAISKLAIEMSDDQINSKPADTFIAAIAKYHKTPIYSLNNKHFEILKAPVYS